MISAIELSIVYADEQVYTFNQIKQNFSKYVVYIQAAGQATGIILNKHFILINNHSVSDSKAMLIISWDGNNNPYDNPKFIGQVVTQDEESDLALVFIKKELPDMPTIPFYNEKLEDLEARTIFAIGNPNGWNNTWSYTKGYVSKSPSFCELEKVKFIGITAAIDTFPGSSGSLVLNEKGEFIGMTSMLLSGTRFTNIISAEVIKNFIQQSFYMIEQMAKQK